MYEGGKSKLAVKTGVRHGYVHSKNNKDKETGYLHQLHPYVGIIEHQHRTSLHLDMKKFHFLHSEASQSHAEHVLVLVFQSYLRLSGSFPCIHTPLLPKTPPLCLRSHPQSHFGFFSYLYTLFSFSCLSYILSLHSLHSLLLSILFCCVIHVTRQGGHPNRRHCACRSA